MGGAICCEKNYQQKMSLRNSLSLIDYDTESIKIINTELTLVSCDLYKFTKRNKVGCVFNIQDTYLEFTDKMFRSHVGDSVIKEYLSLNKVMHTKGGKANCDYILHGCYTKEKSPDNDSENLKIIVTEALKYADKTLKCSSIVFPLNQLKTNCSKTCLSVILACQNFINESFPNNLNTILFVGDEENSIKFYRKALNTVIKIKQNEDSYLQNESNNDDKINEYETNPVKTSHIRKERTSSSRIQKFETTNQTELLQTPQNKIIPQQKSQTKISSLSQNEITELNTSQLMKSGIRMPNILNKDNNNVVKNYNQKGDRKEKLKTQNDLEQSSLQQSKNEKISSERCSVSNINKNNSYQSGITKDQMIEKQKTNQKKQLENYKTTFESEFNLAEEEQKQLKKELKKKNIEKRRNMKTEYLQTNITQSRDDDDTSEKNHSDYKDDNQESFQSCLESDQITSLINNQKQNCQYEDSLFKQGLNSNQESHDPNLMYMNSNMLSHKLVSFN